MTSRHFWHTPVGKRLWFPWGKLWFAVLALAARCLYVKHVQLGTVEAPNGKKVRLIVCSNVPMDTLQVQASSTQSVPVSAWE